jgi:putative two-component system response regulator
MNEAGAATSPKMKLLIVDDEPLNVALLEDILAESGYTRVRSLTDSREAVAMCKEFQPDLVLLDLLMPHVDGFAILETLRSSSADLHVPVIVLTADVSDETKRRALRAGATDFLLKPFDHVEVLLRLKNLLELRRLQSQLDMQRSAFEEAVRARTEEIRELRTRLAEPAAAA